MNSLFHIACILYIIQGLNIEFKITMEIQEIPVNNYNVLFFLLLK